MYIVLAFGGLTPAAECMEANGPRSHNVPPEGQQEITFTLTKLAEDTTRYSLVISNSEEHVISGYFSVDQLEILLAIMTEAETFALGDQGVGVKEPITTRFKDKREPAFCVDVEKMGNQSGLFLTLTTEIGSITTDSGKVIRSSRRRVGFFFDLLSRLESTLPDPKHSK